MFDINVYNPRIKKEEDIEVSQVAIFGHWKENPYIDPKYLAELVSIEDPVKRAAWAEGRIDALMGDAFGDVWNSNIHILPRFKIPKDWYVDRSFDWGSTRPFSVCWWAESNGEEITLSNGKIIQLAAGSLIQIDEWYGTKELGTNKGLRMAAGDVAKGIVEREEKLIKNGWVLGSIHDGPADNSIRDVREIDVDTIEKKMQDNGVSWESSNKSPGSRVNGLEIARERLLAAKRGEEPGLYVMNNCVATINIVPALPRDEDKVDDIDTDAEDHIWDSMRYRVLKGSNRYVTALNVKMAH